jgi:hypothetical protein
MKAGLFAKDSVDPREHQSKFGEWQPAHARRQQILVDTYDLRHVSYGILRQSRKTRCKMEVPWGQGPFEIAGQRNADNRSNAAPIEGVTLHHNDRPTETRTGACWRREIRPPDLTLRDYHSLRSRVRRAAEDTNTSLVSPASVHARFMASVTSSGAW